MLHNKHNKRNNRKTKNSNFKTIKEAIIHFHLIYIKHKRVLDSMTGNEPNYYEYKELVKLIKRTLYILNRAKRKDNRRD